RFAASSPVGLRQWSARSRHASALIAGSARAARESWRPSRSEKKRAATGKAAARAYSRAAWTELQLQFRPPRDGPSVGTRLRHYAMAEEIDVALAALQQVRRDLSLRKKANRAAEKRTIKEAARPQALSPATADFRFRCHRKPAGDVGYGMPSA